MIIAVSLVLALGAVLIPAMGLWERVKAERGIGWQFIRFCVVAMALPIVGILGLSGALNGEAATIIGTALGYAFGHSSDQGRGTNPNASGT
jgi:hypothetical protein